MAVNTINELITLLNNIDQDAQVIAAIANDAADSTANGPSAGLVTTRLGSNVRNIQKLIEDLEAQVGISVRADIQDDSVNILTGPDTINFIGNGVAVTDVGGVATVDIDANLSVNAQTGTSYTLAIADAKGIVTMNNAGANTVTIDAVGTTAYPLGAHIRVAQLGAGATTISAGPGVTLNGVTAGSGTLTAQYDIVELIHVASDVWLATGDIGAIA